MAHTIEQSVIIAMKVFQKKYTYIYLISQWISICIWAKCTVKLCKASHMYANSEQYELIFFLLLSNMYNAFALTLRWIFFRIPSNCGSADLHVQQHFIFLQTSFLQYNKYKIEKKTRSPRHTHTHTVRNMKKTNWTKEEEKNCTYNWKLLQCRLYFNIHSR